MTAGTDSKFVTLEEFIRKGQKRHEALGRLSNVLYDIALSTKILSRGVNRAGISSMLGLTGSKNVQGEQVQKLDDYADGVFNAVLGRSGEFISMVSEERESVIPAKEGGYGSKYVIAFDPLDGSSNIDVNVSIGTIFGIYKRVSTGHNAELEDPQDFFQEASEQVAAGYTIYGSSTMFVFTTGEGVHGFTLDPSIGEFVLTNYDMKIPSVGKYYSCNEGNVNKWSPGIQKYIQAVKEGIGGKPACGLRYVGSLVADFHRTLLKGGIFLYPGDKKNPSGKLRFLYECAPMAFIAEQAGGRASNGEKRLLDIQAHSIHERSPLVIGSSEMVADLEKMVAEAG